MGIATVRRAGLLALVSYVEGTCHYRVPLHRLRDAGRLEVAPAASGATEADDLVAQPTGG